MFIKKDNRTDQINDDVEIYNKKINFIRFAAKGFVVILLICLSLFIVFRIFDNVSKSYTYYFKDGIIEDKITDSGFLGIDNYYLKVKFNAGSDLVDTGKKNYYLCEKGQKIYVVYSKSKKQDEKVDKLFLSDKDLLNYMYDLELKGYEVNLNK